VRLIVDGGPSVPGRTMTEKLQWLRRHGDDLRRLLMLEPRGHAGMHGAMLTEPVSPNAHTGLLSMHSAGFPLLSGEGIIGALTIAVQHKLIHGVESQFLIDTPAGVLRTDVRMEGERVTSVAVTGVPSFVHSAGLIVRIGARTITVDVAFGGEFYAIADSEAIGIPIDIANAAALIRMGREIQEAVEPTQSVQGAIFTGAARTGADVRSATVLDGEVLRRSAGVTSTAALMAVLAVMGVLPEEHRFTHEGVLGKTLQGKIATRLNAEDAAIIPVIEGSASITGFHEFVKG
jgi:proline racemase